MPPDGVEWKAHDEVLSFEEIERFARIAVEEGISKIRLTGGEPLVRSGVVDHVRRLRDITGLEAIALTTNGILLRKRAAALAEAGLTRVNISLDTLDPDVYSQITRGGKLADALDGIEAAFEAGMAPIKLNVVVVRHLEQDLGGFARMTLERPVHVRFIEYMPVGEAEADSACAAGSGGWTSADHVPSEEIIGRLTMCARKHGFGSPEPVARTDAPGGWGPARYYRFPGAVGTIGVISPLSHHFCGECNRLRLTADGKLRACLFSDDELDTKSVLREGSDDDVRALIKHALEIKPEGHEHRVGTTRKMSQIGG
jgi:cyclic pyranopterin phosphate synthase